MIMVPWNLHSNGVGGSGKMMRETSMLKCSYRFYLILNAKNKISLINGIERVGEVTLSRVLW